MSHTLKLATAAPSVEVDRRLPSGLHGGAAKQAPEPARGCRCARTFGSPLRLAGRRLRAWEVDGRVVDDVSRGWAPLTEERASDLPPFGQAGCRTRDGQVFDENGQGRPHEAVTSSLACACAGTTAWGLAGQAARVKRERRIVALVIGARRPVAFPSA